MRLNEFLQPAAHALRHARNAAPRTRVRLSIFFVFAALLLAFAAGCAPTYSPESGALPELTDEVIRERINDTGVWDVPEETGTGEPISWRFDQDEPKEITVVEKQIDGARATIVLDIKTRSALNRRNARALAGQIRTEWELKTGMALRRWEIVRTENISMKYKNLPKPPAENSNR